MRNVILIVLLMCSLVYAGPIGSPTATLEQGKASIGADMSTTRRDIQIYGTKLFDGLMKDYQSDQLTATVSLGVTDRFEVFGTVGYLEGDGTIDGERVMGAGARATIAENVFAEGLDIGITGQFNLARLEGSVPVTIGKCWWKRTIPVDMSVDLMETIFALGATYTTGDLSIYGGPALYRLDGDIEATSSFILGNEDGSIKETTSVLGYVGAAWEVMQDVKITSEYGFGSDYQNIGLGVIWRF